MRSGVLDEGRVDSFQLDGQGVMAPVFVIEFIKTASLIEVETADEEGGGARGEAEQAGALPLQDNGVELDLGTRQVELVVLLEQAGQGLAQIVASKIRAAADADMVLLEQHEIGRASGRERV